MKLTLPVISLIWLTLTAAAPQQKSNDIWSKYGDQLAAEGITEPMTRQAMLWVEFQYHLGICRAYINEDHLVFWRLWWKNTPIEKSEMGSAILKAGDTGFYDGIQDAQRKPLTPLQCRRLIDSWLIRMKAAMPTKDAAH